MSESDPVCSRCNVTSSVLWQRDQQGSIVCLECHTKEKASTLRTDSGESDVSGKKEGSGQSDARSLSGKQSGKSKQNSVVSQTDVPSPVPVMVSGVTTRRTTRSHERAKARQQQQQQQQSQSQSQETSSSSGASPSSSPQLPLSEGAGTQSASKPDASNITSSKVSPPSQVDTPSPSPSGNGHTSTPTTYRSRRSLTQGEPACAAEHQNYLVTTNSVQHRGVTFEVGDVVSVLDRDGGVYYAIPHGFVLDQYADKYVLLTWLLPKTPNPMYFDPAMFILGPEDDVPRSMDHIEFVCHSPQSRHFQSSYLHNIEQAELWLSSNHN